MKRVYSMCAVVLCIFALNSHNSAEAAFLEGLAVFNKAIQALDKGLDLYEKKLDKVVPWNNIKSCKLYAGGLLNSSLQNGPEMELCRLDWIKLDKLDEFRKDYSKEAANMIGDLRAKMKTGIDTYYMASRSITEWCDFAIPLLSKYKSLLQGKMNESTFKAEKKLMLDLLNKGIEKMGQAQSKLETSSTSFNVASGRLTSLSYRLESDFNEKSDYFKTIKSQIQKTVSNGGTSFTLFGIAIAAGTNEAKIISDVLKKMKSIGSFFKELKTTIAKGSKDIDDTKKKISDEIRVIGGLKTKTEETKIYVDSDDGDGSLTKISIEAVNGLIDKCNIYKNRHKYDPKRR